MNPPNSCNGDSKGGCLGPIISFGLCRSHYKKQYRKNNLDKLKAAEDALRQKNPGRAKAQSQKFKYSPGGRYGFAVRAAAKRKLTFTLTRPEYVELISNPCYYCEYDMPKSMGVGLDRIDNNRGYDSDNVLTCCGDCNLLRMHKLTVEETKLLAVTLRRFREAKVAA